MNGCIVYEHENLVNGKKYFGITIKKPTARWGGDGSGYKSNKHFWNAIQKYGWNEGFSHKILFDGLSVAEAREIEEMLIDDYKTHDPKYGYNGTHGGELERPNEETKRKMSNSTKAYLEKHPETIRRGENHPSYGKRHSEESRRKMSEALKGENHPNYGKHLSKETRRKISEANKAYYEKHPEANRGKNNPMYGRTGEKNPMYGKHRSEETRRKISEAHKGKTLSEETRRKLSEANKGENHPMYGKHFSEEARRNMSEAQKKRFENNCVSEETRRKISEAMKGENHPNYGKHLSEETRRKISCAHKGKPLGEEHRRKMSRPVEAIDPETGLRVYYFESINAAGRAEFSSGCICKCCQGKSKTHKGLIWRYVEKETN